MTRHFALYWAAGCIFTGIAVGCFWRHAIVAGTIDVIAAGFWFVLAYGRRE